MNRLVWKLLRRHVSVPQFTGFFFANLLGMLVVLLSIQFYSDVVPVFTQGDSFIKNDYLILSKRISMVGSLMGRDNGFTENEIEDIRKQTFCKSVGRFSSTQYHVAARMGMEGFPAMTTDLFFESVPDQYIDANLNGWRFSAGDEAVVPIILPRSYLAIYNFGFAQSRSLPQLSESSVGLMNMDLRMNGNGKMLMMKGRVIGFSNRLNTILVPESFLEWSNSQLAPDEKARPVRLIVEVDNPANDAIARYLQDEGYDVEENKLDAGKTTFFLKLVSVIVFCVGVLISVLSFYMLMLSIYLLVQKNTVKLQNLLLIGYSPTRVGLPYQCLTVGLNFLVFLLAVFIVMGVRHYYLGIIQMLFPNMATGGMWPSWLIGSLLFIGVSLLNILAIRKKIWSIWKNKA